MAVQKTFRFISDWGATITWQVDDRTTSSLQIINPGEPLKIAATADFATPLATGDPEVGTDEFIGLARKASTETSSADGVVEIITPVAGKTILRGLATTAANVDTASELNALRGNHVNADVTALTGTNGDFTIDEDETDDPNGNAFVILRGNTLKGTLDCLINVLTTVAGSLVGQTID